MIRVFIADDEEPARDRLKELLGDVGAEVPNVVAGEARNGIEALERLPASGAQVLLLDIRMPGMDGPEAARRIRAEPGPNRDAPILAFSANHELDAASAALFDGHVLKPIEVGALLAALAQATAWEDALAATG